MNKVMLMGRLTRNPEVRYSQSATPVSVVRYGIAVRRVIKQQGQPDTDFFNIVAFGKAGEFAEKYFRKGQMVAVVGRLQVNTWEDQQKVKHTSVDVIVEEQHFAESKRSTSTASTAPQEPADPTVANQQTYSSMPMVPDEEDDDLPF